MRYGPNSIVDRSTDLQAVSQAEPSSDCWAFLKKNGSDTRDGKFRKCLQAEVASKSWQKHINAAQYMLNRPCKVQELVHNVDYENGDSDLSVAGFSLQNVFECPSESLAETFKNNMISRR